jgi:hypothetical protein
MLLCLSKWCLCKCDPLSAKTIIHRKIKKNCFWFKFVFCQVIVFQVSALCTYTGCHWHFRGTSSGWRNESQSYAKVCRVRMWFDYIIKLLWQCSVASQNSAWGEGIESDWCNRNCDRGKYKNWDTKVTFPVLQFLLTRTGLYYLCSSCGSDRPHSLKPM